MTTYTFTTTAKQDAGLAAVVADVNAQQDATLPQVTASDYLLQRIAALLDGYADAHGVGAIPVGEFIRRFAGAEVDKLKALSASDPNVAGFMAALDNAPGGKVWLYSTTVAQAKAYLVGIGALAAARADMIFAVA